MVRIIRKMRRGGAWYWRETGIGSNGDSVYADPVLIECRWEDKQVEMRDAEGTKKMSKSRVYVDRVMEPGDLLENIPGRLWKAGRCTSLRFSRRFVFWGLVSYKINTEGTTGETPPTHTEGKQTIDGIEYEVVKVPSLLSKKHVERIDHFEQMPSIKYRDTLYTAYV